MARASNVVGKLTSGWNAVDPGSHGIVQPQIPMVYCSGPWLSCQILRSWGSNRQKVKVWSWFGMDSCFTWGINIHLATILVTKIPGFDGKALTESPRINLSGWSFATWFSVQSCWVSMLYPRCLKTIYFARSLKLRYGGFVDVKAF